MSHVLAADDEAVSRLVLVRMLGALGLDVTEAADAPEAIALFDASPFDLIVADYQMPRGTGLDIAEVTTATGVPFILLTGFGGHGNLDDDRLELVDAHLTKPVSSAELAEVIGDVLATRARDRRSPQSTRPTTPAIDSAVLQRLTTELGDERVTVSVIEAFLDDIDERRKNLVAALRSGHHELARREAHTLAAPCETVGAFPLAAHCQAIERGDAVGRSSDVAQRLDELVLAARENLEAWLRSAESSIIDRF